jgi:hypothetical protein
MIRDIQTSSSRWLLTKFEESSEKGSVSVRGLLQDFSAVLEEMSSELSFDMSCANRLWPLALPNPGLLSPGILVDLFEPPIAKLPNDPITALVGVPEPQEVVGTLFPAVLLRIRPPNGELCLTSSTRSSSPSLSVLLLKNGDGSSLKNRPFPAGEPSPLIESLVCWRRVFGLFDTGDESPKVFEIEVLRPLAPPCPLISFPVFNAGGFIEELTLSLRSWRC